MKRLLVMSTLLASCTRPTPTTEAPIRADDASVVATASVTASTTTTATATATATAIEEPDAPPGSAYCSKDDDCDWDEPCFAKRCNGGGPKKGFVGCDKSAPPPGTCTCIAHACTLRLKSPAPDTPGCKVDSNCGFVAALGVCKPGAPPAGRIEEEGTLCRCNAGACAVEIVDAVPCTKNTDCSWLEDPRRPAPASKVPRKFPPVKPCSTSEWDSVCGPTGRCRIVAWKC